MSVDECQDDEKILMYTPPLLRCKSNHAIARSGLGKTSAGPSTKHVKTGGRKDLNFLQNALYSELVSKTKTFEKFSVSKKERQEFH